MLYYITPFLWGCPQTRPSDAGGTICLYTTRLTHISSTAAKNAARYGAP